MLATLRTADPAERTQILARWMRDADDMRRLAEADDVEAVLLEVRDLVSASAASSLRRRLKTAATPLQIAPPTTVPTLAALDGPDLPIPPGWVVRRDGVWRVVDDDLRLVARRPVAVQGLYRDADTGHMAVDLTWTDDRGWTSRVVPRAVIADARQLARLADEGVPVTSPTAGVLTAWLSEQEHAASLPVRSSTSRCGWHGTSYQAGHTTHGPDPIAIMPEDAVAPLADAVRQEGTWQGWCRAVEAVAERPHVYLAIYAAIASACMAPCGVDVGAVVSMIGRRGRGKTTMLRLAASVWGRPAEVGGLIRSWDSTPYHIEQAAALCCDLGLLLDDTSRVGRPEVVPQMVYTLANGGGRGRGTERARSWRVVALSTGEAPLRSFGGQEGASARTLEVTGDPLHTADAAQQLEWALEEHYGHLGPLVVERLQGRPRARLRGWYRERVRELQRQHPGHSRSAKVVALLDFAARTAHKVGLPAPQCDVWSWLWSHIEDHAASSDQPRRAWDIYLARRAAEIAGKRWDYADPTPVEAVRSWLRAADLIDSAMVDEWVRRGWVATEASGRVQRHKLSGRRVSCIIPTDDAP